MNRILLTFFGTGVIKIFAAARGNAEVGLFDVPQHFVVELGRERLDTLANRRGVGVLSFKILDHFSIRFLAQANSKLSTTVSP